MIQLPLCSSCLSGIKKKSKPTKPPSPQRKKKSIEKKNELILTKSTLCSSCLRGIKKRQSHKAH
jgi:hypothetical protein